MQVDHGKKWYGGSFYPRTSGARALSSADLDTLFQKITHLEDEALIRFAVATGLRREDCVNVKLQDLDLEKGIVRFYESKKRRPWRAWFGPETAKILAQHINALPKGTPYLFPSPRGVKRHLSSRQAYNILQKWLERAGLARRPFHALRATCMKQLQRRGWSMEQVMMQTGDSFRTIKEHYETPSDEEMFEAAKKTGI